MAELIIVLVLVLVILAVAAKLSPFRNRMVTAQISVNRLASAALVLILAGLVGWLLGYIESSTFRWPHITLNDLAKLGPMATAVTFIAVSIAVGMITWQKNTTRARDAWWARSQWALDWAYGAGSNDPGRRETGKALVRQQQSSRLVTDEERGFLLACMSDQVENPLAAVDFISEPCFPTKPPDGASELTR